MRGLFWGACFAGTLVPAFASASEPPLRQRPGDAAPVPEPGPVTKTRHGDVGAELGVASRPASGGDVSYGAGVAYGGFVRGDIVSWLSVRFSARREQSTASLGSLAISGAHFDDADLGRTYLSFAVEPQWSPLPRLTLWTGLGVGWGRTACPALYSRDADNVVIPARAGAFFDFPLSLGARYEIVRDWVLLHATASGSLLAGQSGTLFAPVQIVDQAGAITTAPGFPELGASVTALLGVSVVL